MNMAKSDQWKTITTINEFAHYLHEMFKTKKYNCKNYCIFSSVINSSNVLVANRIERFNSRN